MFFILFSFNGILLYLSLKDDFNMQTCRESPFIHLFIQLFIEALLHARFFSWF